MDYRINKGAGRPIEFKGLKSQYLFFFAGGLVSVFLAVVVLYMAYYQTLSDCRKSTVFLSWFRHHLE